jgi:hypothetical protein
MQSLVAVYPSRRQAEQVRQRLLQSGIANERVALNSEAPRAMASAERTIIVAGGLAVRQRRSR